MRAWYPAALFALTLIACGVTHKTITGPDGRPGWFTITCEGRPAVCIEEARDACPDGYDTATSGGRTIDHGQMLIHCHRYGQSALVVPIRAADAPKAEASTQWTTVKSSEGYSFKVPDDWITEPINGHKAHHPPDMGVPLVYMTVWSHEGTLEEYTEKNYADRKVKETEIDGRKAAIAVKVDKLNGRRLRIVSAVVIDSGTAYELTCADSLLEETSETCKTICRSLKLSAR